MAKTNYVADAQAIQHLIADGVGIRGIQRAMSWTFHRTRQAFHLATTGKVAKYKYKPRGKKPEPSPELPAEAQPKEKKKPVRITSIPVQQAKLSPGRVHRYLFTAAQDDTPVHEPFLKNLEAYAAYVGAKIVVGGFTYQIGVFADHSARGNYYHPRAEQYLLHDRLQVGPDLLFVSTANILPTASNPVAQWITANRGNHVVVPHARVALESISRTSPTRPPRFAMSTGCITEPNYTPRSSGQRGLDHHTYGAVLAEVDIDGEVFLRSITATDDGSFQDLDVSVIGGVCTPDRRVQAIAWGDIHHQQLDPNVAMASWGYDLKARSQVTYDCLLDGLMPEMQFFHDTLDFRTRNHHDTKSPRQRMRVKRDTTDNVEDEVTAAAAFVNSCCRDWSQSVMIESNHDNALARWLDNVEGHFDTENSYYWRHLGAIWDRSIKDGNEVNIVEWAMREAGLSADVGFVASGGEYPVDGTEFGMHGDLGTGGAPGTPNQFRRFGIPTMTGHTHAPKIIERVMVVGVSGKLFQGYNKGGSAWAHAHGVQYYNGTRTLIIIVADGRHRAMGDRVHANWPDTPPLAA